MLRKILSSIVYSHLWIAACASALILQTEYLILGTWEMTSLVALVFGGTLIIYALHRLVGLSKLKAINAPLNARYQDINKAKPIIITCVIIGLIISLLAFIEINNSAKYWLILPTLISFGYVIPIPKLGKRLRDIGIIKLFLIALVYGFVTVLLPFINYSIEITNSGWLLFAEKTIFIWAITIPFDIRDISVDNLYGTSTLPNILGEKKAKYYAIAALLICFFLTWNNDMYSIPGQIALSIAYLVSIWLIRLSHQERSDLFYSFTMDGLMILQTGILFISTFYSL